VGTLEGDRSGTIGWSDSFLFDHGTLPAVVATSSGNVVEVHQGDSGSLWFSSGVVNGTTFSGFGPAAQYDNGYRPYLARDDEGGGIETHQATSQDGALWERAFITF
jgi:hypothetical protein